MGFFNKGKTKLYTNIHCYLNILTLDRDSLFQAEARRCVNIIHSLKNKGNHFCIFDELYSGTNHMKLLQVHTIYRLFKKMQS